MTDVIDRKAETNSVQPSVSDAQLKELVEQARAEGLQPAGVFPHRRPGAGHDVQVMQQDNDHGECWCYMARLSIVSMSTVDVVAGENSNTC
ncbi:hypothetical protein [Rhodococcus sp. DMU1]|uniref:hypothetical protein n=1 Tax=Rhodococcus sp. DMU1 TaxID=2722825 RepID=UPI00143E377F|nr:hypothetical protein [Rhodococcus sp. DMU1]QIX53685.1 hypothetical protein HFP48_29075 [Rhodococcus sp. DMU1]